MLRQPLAIEVAYDIAAAVISHRGLSPSNAAPVLQRFFGVAPLIKRNDSGGPGSHGIPEIGAHEEDFFRALQAGGADALRDLKALVERLYSEGRGWEGIDPYTIDQPIEAWKRKALIELATHPMQAYLLGQLFATEAIKAETMRPILPTDREAIAFLDHYAFNEISSKFDELKGDLRHALIAGVQQGQNPREVAREMANRLDDYETDWGTIAITETARAESQGRLQELLDQGYQYVITSAAHDSSTCDWCREHDGEVFQIRGVIGRSNYGRKKDAWIPGVLPAHPRCRDVYLPSGDPQ